jgi:hypothetical protein
MTTNMSDHPSAPSSAQQDEKEDDHARVDRERLVRRPRTAAENRR